MVIANIEHIFKMYSLTTETIKSIHKYSARNGDPRRFQNC